METFTTLKCQQDEGRFVPLFNGVGPFVAVPVFTTSNISVVFYCLMSTHIRYYSSLARATARRFQEELLNYIYCTFFKSWLFPCI
jgi:hypothetical protein